MSRETRSLVTLPDGREAVEIEILHVGGSETQATYDYYEALDLETDKLAKGKKIDKRVFLLNWWGKVERAQAR